jgi:hypothetical protein
VQLPVSATPTHLFPTGLIEPETNTDKYK